MINVQFGANRGRALATGLLLAISTPLFAIGEGGDLQPPRSDQVESILQLSMDAPGEQNESLTTAERVECPSANRKGGEPVDGSTEPVVEEGDVTPCLNDQEELEAGATFLTDSPKTWLPRSNSAKGEWENRDPLGSGRTPSYDLIELIERIYGKSQLLQSTEEERLITNGWVSESTE